MWASPLGAQETLARADVYEQAQYADGSPISLRPDNAASYIVRSVLDGNKHAPKRTLREDGPMRIKHTVRTISLALLLVSLLGTRGGAQSATPSRQAQIGGAIGGAFVGAALGAVLGYAIGSLGAAEPSCVASPGATCKGHNFAGQGARIGLSIGIPIGAIIGWRRAR
jgi:hypothetical protein